MKYSYVAMLIFVILGSGWLEFALKTNVYRRWRRWLPSLLPVMTLFIFWDRYAIAHQHWWFDENQTLGIYGPFGIPIEEYLFFVVVPIASILTLEAVRSVKVDWVFGDEQ